jgi:protein-tyrosine-phosphatase
MPRQILVICTANICRSPMAGALLQHALRAQEGALKSVEVVSAGIAAHEGEAVSENSVIALRKVGIDISGHRARALTSEMASEALAIFCMTEAHRDAVLMNVDPPPGHLYLFREFLPEGSGREIADPFGSSITVYEASRDEMVEAIPSVKGFLRKVVGEEQSQVVRT